MSKIRKISEHTKKHLGYIVIVFFLAVGQLLMIQETNRYSVEINQYYRQAFLRNGCMPADEYAAFEFPGKTENFVFTKEFGLGDASEVSAYGSPGNYTCKPFGVCWSTKDSSTGVACEGYLQ